MARQNFIGLVVSCGKMQKTVKVRVETKVFNKRINKELFHRKDYLVHDEKEVSREGDLVRIEATRPLSKRKFFSIAEIIRNKGQQFAQFESKAKVRVAREEMELAQDFLSRRAIKEHENSILLQDIAKLRQAYQHGNIDSAEIKEIRERYGVEEFTTATIKQLLQLDISAMEANLKKQRCAIDEIAGRIKVMLENEEEANAYLESKGVAAPAELKRNIKKNILRKHILAEQNL